MESLKGLLPTVDILNETEAMLDSVNDLVKESDPDGGVREETGPVDADEAVSFQSTNCNDGERAILAGYVSLMRKCIELAEKVGAAKA